MKHLLLSFLYLFIRDSSKRHKWQNVFIFLLRWGSCLLLSGVFLYAGIEKTLEFRLFAEAIAAYQLLPEVLVNPVALVLPVVEVALAVMLLVPGVQKMALLGMGVLLGVFLLGLAQALARGIVLDCGCFGKSEMATTGGMLWAIARDLGMLVVAGWLFFMTKGEMRQMEVRCES